MGPGRCLVGTRYSTLPAHPQYHTPGTPLPHRTPEHEDRYVSARGAARSNMAVGLISVCQLSLDAHISDIGLITEVYNLAKIGRISNHFFIPGNN